MNDFFSWINSGTTEQKNKKRTVAYALAIVSVLLVISLIALAAIGIVTSIRSKNASEEPEETVDPYKGYTTTTFAEGQLYRGDLIWTDDTYVYNPDANASVETITIRAGRAQIESGALYSSDALDVNVQKVALDAMNQMLLDFYTETTNEYVWVCIDSSSSAFAAGNTFSLKYTTMVEGAEKPSISGVEDYKWIYDNAYKYGFVQLYSAPEASTEEGAEAAVDNTNVFRYVGTVHASLMKDKECATLSEYLELLKNKTTYKTHFRITIDKVTYEAYYIPASGEMLVPEKYLDSYTVSGNNMDGYIVTVCTTTSK